ncbi:hypothetical protein EM308_06980 [Flavobacterium gilvum]|uniref:Thioredoxin domain-containing protein n=1 Tax=Flavobacterium gilvum TaxID=1492737 RepID=A0AAC9I446_9FLAO|nr:hypothetical protein EM308_06980 [Flavobacterium gilvum]
MFSQKSIENPDYGLSTIPGSLTKIEFTAESTILHFHIQYQPGQWISVPKESYIQDVNGGEKKFVSKTEGIPLGEKYIIPESGEVNYQLYFPKLGSSINKIDFGEANEGASWSVYDIVINEQEGEFLMPKELRGNWFQTNGSNQWDYGFYASNAIVDKAIWNYKTVKKDKNEYTIVLERNGIQKTLYAQIVKKGQTNFGFNKLKMQSYSTTKIENPNYKLANDKPYVSGAIFKSDMATYSGVIKGYTPRVGRKTGTIYVNNVFTGNQDSYLVKIADDGSFSVKFPINHPQSVLLNYAGTYTSVFVEPGKKIFQLIDNENGLFMGDCVRVNTDLKALEKIQSYEDYRKLTENILETSPKDFKEACLAIKNKQTEALKVLVQKQLISQKAFQIKKLDIEFRALTEILSYEMNREDAQRNESSKVSQNKNRSEQVFKLDKSYYDFITQSILNDETDVLARDYDLFINRLSRANSIFKGNPFSPGDVRELQEINRKTYDFLKANNSKIQDFKKNHKEVYDKLYKEKLENEVTVVGDLASELMAQGIVLTTEEKELLASYKLAELIKVELQLQKHFTDKYGKKQEPYYEKYNTNIQEFEDERNFNELNSKLKEVFGINEAFVYDVITLQDNAGGIEKNFAPYTDNRLKWVQGKIKHPFLSNYIVSENNRVISKIAANKKQSGFTVNAVKETEGDEIFESMISKFKGKVIYVDFWATWCGPCMLGIKNIASLKEEMKNEDVVFLYITDQTSPEKTWNNIIPNIKGEHYRVSQDEWNFLTQKFNISGIPHYVLVNKKNEIVNPNLEHNANETLKKILEEQLK